MTSICHHLQWGTFSGISHTRDSLVKQLFYPPGKYIPWKLMVGRWKFPLAWSLFRGSMLIFFRRVHNFSYFIFRCHFTWLDLWQGASPFCCKLKKTTTGNPALMQRQRRRGCFCLKAKLLLRKRASPSSRLGALMLKRIKVSLLHPLRSCWRFWLHIVAACGRRWNDMDFPTCLILMMGEFTKKFRVPEMEVLKLTFGYFGDEVFLKPYPYSWSSSKDFSILGTWNVWCVKFAAFPPIKSFAEVTIREQNLSTWLSGDLRDHPSRHAKSRSKEAVTRPETNIFAPKNGWLGLPLKELIAGMIWLIWGLWKSSIFMMFFYFS